MGLRKDHVSAFCRGLPPRSPAVVALLSFCFPFFPQSLILLYPVTTDKFVGILSLEQESSDDLRYWDTMHL